MATNVFEFLSEQGHDPNYTLNTIGPLLEHSCKCIGSDLQRSLLIFDLLKVCFLIPKDTEA